MAYLLDSDVIIEYFRGDRETKGLIEKIQEKGLIASSVLNLVEVKRGTREQELPLVNEFFDSIIAIAIDKEIAEKAVELALTWKKKGRIIQLVDSCIAATCILNDFTLVTYNKKDYPMRELKIV